jgi:hypothetical protein
MSAVWCGFALASGLALVLRELKNEFDANGSEFDEMALN